MVITESWKEKEMAPFSALRKTDRNISLFIAAVFSLSLLSAPAAADYQMPPKAIADLVDAPPTPSVMRDPSNQWMLILERPNLISIEELAQPEFRLAGMRINPRTHGPSRLSYYTAMKLLSIEGGIEIAVKGLPQDARIRNVRWAPDSKKVAFVITKATGQDLWVADAENGSARKLISDSISSVYGLPFAWLGDSKTLICKTVPDDMGPAPAAQTVPTGPVIQQTSGREAPARTYQDLLKNPHDQAMFEHLATVQITKVRLTGNRRAIGATGIIRRVQPSPDGRYILVETVHKPFSYLVPASRFPYRVEVWDLDGNLVKQIADLPLAEEIPIAFGAVPTGPRSFGWRSDVPAMLYWVEAQDGGDPKAEAQIRDKVYTLSTPFAADPKPLASLELRYSGITWGNKNLALAYGRRWKDRRMHVWSIDPDSPESDKTLLFDYSWQDRYNVPGSVLTKRLPNGYSVLLMDKRQKMIYLAADGASPEGDRPFIDQFRLANKKKTRLWRCEAPYYETPVDFLNLRKLKLLTRRESINEPANYFLRNLKRNRISQITHFPHPTPQLKDVQKELIRYERADGVKMTATLYLPPGYKAEDGPLPMLMWAYPREFKSAKAAGQVTSSPYRFVRVSGSSPLLWLAAGFAVLDNPTMPIVGEGDDEPNDKYVEQLVASAKAAVDEVVRRGVAERGRIAIGGHSYGAFMTANLLANSDLFSAGIARSGAYNRTLTPFGFQAEERTYWQAPEVYFKMSPFMHANDIDEPILLIHGQMDNNSGTHPMQSERFYNAIKGHGGTARLVMLPHESHGYRARESIMHMLREMTDWLEKYVKDGKP
jgi:dipeptidyl aminopeptidase/acylaminoacyl peptidase